MWAEDHTNRNSHSEQQKYNHVGKSNVIRGKSITINICIYIRQKYNSLVVTFKCSL